MSFQVFCSNPRCQKPLHLTAASAGRQVACPSCAQVVQVPPAALPANSARRTSWLWAALPAIVFMLMLGSTLAVTFFLVRAQSKGEPTETVADVKTDADKPKSPPTKTSPANKTVSQPTPRKRPAGAVPSTAPMQKSPTAENALTPNRLEVLDQHALQAAPEDEQSVKALAAYLMQPAQNDRDKARLIFRWMTDRIAYDANAYFGKKRSVSQPQQVLEKRVCVCEGYARLFDALAGAMVLEAQIVPGYARATFLEADNQFRDKHAWNAVKLGGDWQLVDATWGAGHLKGKKYVKHLEEFFFLPPPDQLIFSHFPDDPRWQLLPMPLTREDFTRLPEVPSLLFALFPNKLNLQHVRQLSAADDFAGFAQVFTNPKGAMVTVHEGPMEKVLRDGKQYTFRIASTHHDKISLINNRKWVHLQKSGDFFEGSVTANPGQLILTGRLAGQTRFWDILHYSVKVVPK